MTESPPDSSSSDRPAIGFLGVGHMGRPMVDRMAGAGVPIEVYVRRSELAAELAAAGVATAASPHELAARSDVLILCFFDDHQVRDVMLGDDVISSMRAGSVLISHVTGSPELPVELQDAAPEGVTVLDVPISGTDDQIRRGELTLLVGGDRAALERARPALATYADPILEVGGLGDGQRVKLINNLLFTVNLRFALEAARLAEAMGIEAGELSRIVSACSGGSFAMNLFQHVPHETMADGARHYLVKDVGVIRQVAASLGIELGELGELAGWVFGAGGLPAQLTNTSTGRTVAKESRGSGGGHMKVWVDPEKCRGHALCLMHAPEAFEFIDLEDRSVVVEGAVGAVSVEVFERAANECPERAIVITGET